MNEQGNVSTEDRKWPLVSRISNDSIQKLRSGSRTTRKHWGSFCKSTSIHGMRYLAEPSLKSQFDRVWWFLVVSIGFLMASYYTSRQYVKWSQSAIDANNYDYLADLKEVPFPAFTICDNRKMNASFDEYDSGLEKNLMYLICGDDRIGEFNYTQDSLIALIPPMLMNCTLERVVSEIPEHWTSRCDDLMMRTLTDQGVCYTFNMMNPAEIFKPGVEHGINYHGRSTDWGMNSGYRPGAPMYDKNFTNGLLTGPFPKRGDSAVLLRFFHENNTNPQYCYGDTDGYKVILHNPDEVPMVGNRESPWVPLEKKTKDKYLVFPACVKSLIDFKSRLIVPAENMVQFGTKQRRCYFPGEKELAYFNKYTYNNCQQECLTNLTKSLCGCIDYYMPKLRMPDEPENITRVCTSQHEVKCLLYSFDLWDRNRDRCQCMHSCTTIEYDLVAWYNTRDSDKPVGSGKYEGLLASEIIIYSTAEYFIKSERRAMYTRVDFIADCGGVFGLFCGMSIISVVEFIYYGFLWLSGNKRSKE